MMEKKFVPAHNPRADFAKEFPGIHSSVTGYSTGNMLYGEKYESLRDMGHRYFAYYSGPGPDPLYKGTITSGAFYGIEMLGLFFRFYRGSIRIRYLLRDTRYVHCMSLADTGVNIAGTYLSAPTNPLIEAEVPYYYGDLFQSVGADSNLKMYHSGNADTFMFKSMGDDFSFHFLRALPLGDFVNTATTFGLNGLIGWTAAGNPTTVTVTPNPLPVTIVP